MCESGETNAPEGQEGFRNEVGGVSGEGTRVGKELTCLLPEVIPVIELIFWISKVYVGCMEEGELPEGEGVAVEASMGPVIMRMGKASMSGDLIE